jgi:hypothetical protein
MTPWSWQADIRLANQRLLLRYHETRKIHYRIHNSCPLQLVGSEIKPTQIFRLNFFKHILILSSHLYRGNSSDLLSSNSASKMTYSFFYFLKACCMSRPSYSPLLEFWNVGEDKVFLIKFRYKSAVLQVVRLYKMLQSSCVGRKNQVKLLSRMC